MTNETIAITDEQIEALRSEAGTAGDYTQVELCRRALDGDTAEAWWAWHDADADRHSATLDEAEQRCAAWVAGESDDGPARAADARAECERVIRDAEAQS